ncbi:unnamed protein product [Polarella glacialis]|uniref:Calcineurin-like phosphoesterase domain-containing protein n=1 Tax=Polarella glacialis TaxID=89957 RepID=A0A813H2X5_POLGL|nr:unnamed protein product [Polarella glacialis]
MCAFDPPANLPQAFLPSPPVLTSHPTLRIEMAAASATWQRAALLAALLWALAAASPGLPEDFPEDDECMADSSGNNNCSLSVLQQRGRPASLDAIIAAPTATCGTLDQHENDACRDDVTYFGAPKTKGKKSGKNDPNAEGFMKDIMAVTGVGWHSASRDDLQRLYFCAPPGGHQCGLPPCSCSKPPCHSCFGGVAPPKRVSRPGCEGGGKGIQCQPPAKALGYKGMAWPTMTFPGKKEMHIFAIGDWGGMDGTLNMIENRDQLLVYDGGKRAGPSVFPRTRWDKEHNVKLCGHKQFIECFDSHGYPPCEPGCGFVMGVDDQPQILVANAFKARFSLINPQYILNVGDNFYWGGIEKNCGTPMAQLSYTAMHQFSQIFEGVYTGLGDVPWLSVLGNHDWGGRVFNNGWDQQIAYTWYSKRWIMPSAYWSQHVEYPDLNFTVDIYMLDSNAMDAKDSEEDPEHNLCGAKHNPGNADCSAAEGPPSVDECHDWFWDLWAEQQLWIEKQLLKSEADWQIIVTHFPCGHQKEFYEKLHQIDYGSFPNVSRGLDLLVTGHRHDQELWDPAKVRPGDDLRDFGGLTCFVTGGGGGITSEATPNPDDRRDWYGEAQYGFYDLTITKDTILIKSINYDGKEVQSATVQSLLGTMALSAWSLAVQQATKKNLKSAHETNKLAKRLYAAVRRKAMKAAPAKKAAMKAMKATKAMKAAPAMKSSQPEALSDSSECLDSSASLLLLDEHLLARQHKSQLRNPPSRPRKPDVPDGGPLRRIPRMAELPVERSD